MKGRPSEDVSGDASFSLLSASNQFSSKIRTGSSASFRSAICPSLYFSGTSFLQVMHGFPYPRAITEPYRSIFPTSGMKRGVYPRSAAWITRIDRLFFRKYEEFSPDILRYQLRWRHFIWLWNTVRLPGEDCEKCMIGGF